MPCLCTVAMGTAAGRDVRKRRRLYIGISPSIYCGVGGHTMHCDHNACMRTLLAKASFPSTQRSDPGAMSDVILETHSLTKEFKGFTAVSDVNLAVRRGSIHALIGPNGAGKTTCFNLLTKFLTPTSGTIRFNGHDITREQPAQIARRGVIRSMQLLTEVGLEDLADEVTVNLPYGRKRALEIATTLAMEPELMLLDEPTQGMGHEDVDRVTQLIKKVSAGRTILMVEHNMKVVSTIADRITVLQRGAVLAEGPYEEVSNNPQVMEAYMGTTDGQLQGAH